MRTFTFFIILIVIVTGCHYLTKHDKMLPAVSSGLVAYYPFNGEAKDESGNKNHPIVYGASLTTDRFGHQNMAYYFDGINDYMKINDASILNPSEEISYGCWVKFNNLNRKNQPLFSKTEDSAFSLYFNDYKHLNTITAWIKIDSEYYTTSISGELINTKDWFNVFVTYDGYKMKHYLNGELQITKAVTGKIVPSPYPLLIASEPGDSPVDHFFHGSLDDIIIYNRALSQDEIKALY